MWYTTQSATGGALGGKLALSYKMRNFKSLTLKFRFIIHCDQFSKESIALNHVLCYSGGVLRLAHTPLILIFFKRIKSLKKEAGHRFFFRFRYSARISFGSL